MTSLTETACGAPDLPHLGTDWLQSKNAPGFLPMGPYLMPASFILDPYAVRLSLRLNGETMQDDLVADMMCDIATQIAYIFEYAQLLPGDIICTETPGGCGTHMDNTCGPAMYSRRPYRDSALGG